MPKRCKCGLAGETGAHAMNCPQYRVEMGWTEHYALARLEECLRKNSGSLMIWCGGKIHAFAIQLSDGRYGEGPTLAAAIHAALDKAEGNVALRDALKEPK